MRPEEGERASKPRKTQLAGDYRLAVLPLANISPDPRDEHFSDGMKEELISTPSKIAGLRVNARTSILRYKGMPKPAIEIGRELNVGTLRVDEGRRFSHPSYLLRTR